MNDWINEANPIDDAWQGYEEARLALGNAQALSAYLQELGMNAIPLDELREHYKTRLLHLQHVVSLAITATGVWSSASDDRRSEVCQETEACSDEGQPEDPDWELFAADLVSSAREGKSLLNSLNDLAGQPDWAGGSGASVGAMGALRRILIALDDQRVEAENIAATLGEAEYLRDKESGDLATLDEVWIESLKDDVLKASDDWLTWAIDAGGEVSPQEQRLGDTVAALRHALKGLEQQEAEDQAQAAASGDQAAAFEAQRARVADLADIMERAERLKAAMDRVAAMPPEARAGTEPLHDEAREAIRRDLDRYFDEPAT